MRKSKRILNHINEIIVIYNTALKEIWINNYAREKIKINNKNFIEKFNEYSLDYSFDELIKNKNINKIILDINNKKEYYDLSISQIDNKHKMFVFKNITKLYNKDKLIEEAKYIDELTQINNRNYLLDNFSKDSINKAILFFDIKDFKGINDFYGHKIGDQVLKVISERIKNELKKIDIFCRYGGDEFVAVINKISDIKDIENVGKRISNSVNKEIRISNIKLNIEVNIGYVRYPEYNENIIKLIEYADIAMYYAKRNDIIIKGFNKDLLEKEEKRSELKEHIKLAIKNEKICVEYQDINRLDSKMTYGKEAYVRIYNREVKNCLSVASQSNLVINIDKAVAKEVITSLIDCDEIVFLNISLKSLFSDDYFNYIKKLIKENKADPSKIAFDISEKSIINNITTLKRINKLKTLGVKIAIDDYGTGELSVEEIKQFEFDIIKIDNVFTKNIHKNRLNQKIVKSMIEVSKNFNKHIIAEGIEDRESYEYLKKIGCSYGQGNFISKVTKNDKEKTYELSI